MAGVQANGRPVVLVVDDDPAVCSSLKFSLELEGFSVQTYGTAGALLAAVGNTQARCLIIDYKMPGMNGLDLLRALRERDAATPAILITSHPSTALGIAAAKYGVTIVEKPFLGTALNDSVRQACRGEPLIG